MSDDLFGVTLPEMIRELERQLDIRRRFYRGITLDNRDRHIQILLAIIARLKRSAGEAA